MKWVSVKERLPENDGDYFCWYSGRLKYGANMGLAVFYRGGWLSVNGATYPGQPEPTHWIEGKAPEINQD